MVRWRGKLQWELLLSSEVIGIVRDAVVMLILGQVLRLCSHVVCGGCSSLQLLGPQFFLSLFDLRIFTMLFFRCFLLNLNQASNLLYLSKKITKRNLTLPTGLFACTCT